MCAECGCNRGQQFKWGDRAITPKGHEGKVIWVGKNKDGEDSVGVALSRHVTAFHHPRDLTKKAR